MKAKIQFTVIESGNTITIETYEEAYRDLMVLLKEELSLEFFGECGGMGRCATCVVRANGIKGASQIKNRNEPSTLSKMGYEEQNMRLACQLMITEDLNGAFIELITI